MHTSQRGVVTYCISLSFPGALLNGSSTVTGGRRPATVEDPPDFEIGDPRREMRPTAASASVRSHSAIDRENAARHIGRRL